MCKPFKWDESGMHPLLRMNRFFKKHSKNHDIINDIGSETSISEPPDLNLIFKTVKKK